MNNLVAKHNFNKASVHKDKKKAFKESYQKYLRQKNTK